MAGPSPYLRCLNCGWVHVGEPPPEPALDCCFRCKRLAFEVIDEAAAPRGVTLQRLRWPPIVRKPAIPKDKLTAADILRPWLDPCK